MVETCLFASLKTISLTFYPSHNMNKRNISIIVVCFCLIVGCLGDQLPTEFVTGTLTLDDQPLADARIFFNPKEGGIPAVGHTDKNGKYIITAMQGGGAGKGTVPGEYIVTVSKPVVVNVEGSEGVSETKHLLSLVYIDPAQTPFRATVVKGKNHFDFALKSTPDVEFKPPPGFGK